MKKHWPRWVFASVSQHFDSHRDYLPMFVEGQHRSTSDLTEFIELRMDGPYFSEVSKNYYRARFEINILVQSPMDDTNYHKLHTAIGVVLAAFTEIGIYKYGNGADDDQSFIGCADLLQSVPLSKEKLVINHFGQIEATTKLVQASVEGHYELFLSN